MHLRWLSLARQLQARAGSQGEFWSLALSAQPRRRQVARTRSGAPAGEQGVAGHWSHHLLAELDFGPNDKDFLARLTKVRNGPPKSLVPPVTSAVFVSYSYGQADPRWVIVNYDLLWHDPKGSGSTDKFRLLSHCRRFDARVLGVPSLQFSDPRPSPDHSRVRHRVFDLRIDYRKSMALQGLRKGGCPRTQEMPLGKSTFFRVGGCGGLG